MGKIGSRAVYAAATNRNKLGTLDAMTSAYGIIAKLPTQTEYMLVVMDNSWVELDICCRSEDTLRGVAKILKRPIKGINYDVALIKGMLHVTAYLEMKPCSPKSASVPSKTTNDVPSDGASHGSETESHAASPPLSPSGKLSMPLSRLISLVRSGLDKP